MTINFLVNTEPLLHLDGKDTSVFDDVGEKHKWTEKDTLG